MWIELALLALLGTAGAGAALAWRVGRQLAALELAITAAEARGREQEARLTALVDWRDGQELVEHAADTGVSMVKAVHMGIADIPFSILEAIPPTAVPTRVVRQVHDAISEGIYAALSGLNKAVGRELRKGIGSKPAAPIDAAPARDALQEPRDE
ncbi:hypothetical protein [Solimonas soli]|uniref:hypothetical protein n=1 Tax=Solimonas soli TaxID=413479 RepID=UPI0004B26DF2|nr:hypothetical protein [Solimonas soli]